MSSDGVDKFLAMVESERVQRIKALEAERDRLKAAFDDRVRVIELQLEDKRQMQELIDQYREALESISKNTCCDKCQEAALVAKQALEASDVD